MADENLVPRVPPHSEEAEQSVIGSILIKTAKKILKRTLEKTQLDPVMHPFVISIANILMWVIVVMMVLPVFGIEATSIVAVLGTCGAAVALAVCSTVCGAALMLKRK